MKWNKSKTNYAHCTIYEKNQHQSILFLQYADWFLPINDYFVLIERCMNVCANSNYERSRVINRCMINTHSAKVIIDQWIHTQRNHQLLQFVFPRVSIRLENHIFMQFMVICSFDGLWTIWNGDIEMFSSVFLLNLLHLNVSFKITNILKQNSFVCWTITSTFLL